MNYLHSIGDFDGVFKYNFYEKDYVGWLEENIKLLKENRLEMIDRENLVEELQMSIKQEIDRFVSNLSVVLEHLYKWDHLRDISSGGVGWLISIREHRRKLKRAFEDSPSLKKRIGDKHLKRAWEDARDRIYKWLVNNGYDIKEFKIPEKPPYTWKDVFEREIELP